METANPTLRRKANKPKIENYYKILGVRANATAESIKKNYIQMVKQYPPEQHPETFQQIRRAYETLRDPEKRKEYDFQRKYGGSLESMMDEAYEWMEREEWSKAETLFRKILDISKEAIGAHTGLAQIALIKNNLAAFELQCEQFLSSLNSEEDLQSAQLLIAKLLYDFDYSEEALEKLNALMSRDPENASRYLPLLTAIYRDIGREDEAFAIIESRIPAIEDQQPDQFDLFIDWINVMINLDKWQYWSRVQPRVKKFLKAIDNEDDRTIIISALLQECNEYAEVVRFREAGLFADLAHYLDRNNESVQAERERIQQLMRLENEFKRIPTDIHLHPRISLRALELYYEDFHEDWRFAETANSLIHSLDKEFEDEDIDYPANIRKLRTSYPCIYNRYKQQWDAYL